MPGWKTVIVLGNQLGQRFDQVSENFRLPTAIGDIAARRRIGHRKVRNERAGQVDIFADHSAALVVEQ
ncbi:hypothetical protein ACFROC_37200, partial [Nocardia tengchongensis]|uniref:hypothetical protein n=1 Tax=Nocardia tengchongensis TaxID=2055889 RepID=UPI003692D5E0